VRASRPATSEELEKIVRQIILDRLLEGDLDECDLTLRELDQIRGVFVSILQGLFHPRIKYPPQKQLRLIAGESQVTLPPAGLATVITEEQSGEVLSEPNEGLEDSDQHQR